MAGLGASQPHSHSTSSTAGSRLGLGGRALWVLLYLLPKNAISRAAGWIASRRLPGVLQRFQIRTFAWATGIDLAEAAEPVENYDSLQTFFTRALRPGARPIEGGDDPIDGGTLLQVKGRSYRVRDLLGDVDAADAYEGGLFATFYLSPRDYHRLHTPTAGHVRRIAYHPGGLWPVNAIGLLGVDSLFATNERICAYLDPDDVKDPDGAYEVVGASDRTVEPSAIAMVAVGATMVGSVKLSFDDLTTNRGLAAARRELGPDAPHFARGEEWGRFEFGSTIVLLIPPESFELDVKPPGTPLRLGEVIGKISR
jgi:phosphatidylserine decarboxylase